MIDFWEKMKAMQFRFKHLFLFLFFIVVFVECIITDNNSEILQRIRAPLKIVGNNVLDGSSKERLISFEDNENEMSDLKGSYNRVSVSTVAVFTLAMATVTGLGAVPFFFVELDPQWAGICNGMAAGVMLAASFDLILEGQAHGAGSWVVIGILAGGIFILLCKKILEQYGEVSMLDIKGADATKAVLVIGIMTLHSFGEGSGVGVSFAGSKGFTQGLLVTLAIAVHNIPEGLAVSMVLTSRGVSPQNAMLWSVITSLPQLISEESHFLCNSKRLGPLLGGLALISFALAFGLKHALLMACGIAFILVAWRPLKLLVTSKMGFFPLTFLLTILDDCIFLSSVEIDNGVKIK